MKKWVVAVVIIIVIGSGVLFFLSKRTSVSYQTVKVDRGDISQTVSATGNIDYAFKSYVYTKQSGIVTGVFVSAGSRVRKGQLLARIDDTELRLTYEKLQQSLVQASNFLFVAQKNYFNTKTLYEKQFVSLSEYETARMNYENALANYRNLVLSLQEASYNLENCILKSPVDGVVAVNNLTVGTNLFGGNILAFVVASQPMFMEITTLVSEVDITSIKKGQKVRFTVSAFQDTFYGEVYDILYQPRTSQDVVYYPVIIRTLNSQHKLLPGMSATIEIIVSNRENVLRVPSRALKIQPSREMLALFTNNFSGAHQVSSSSRGSRTYQRSGFSGGDENIAILWVVDESKGTLYPVRVCPGLSDGQYTEIIPLRSEDSLEGKSILVSVVGTKKKTTQQIPSQGGIRSSGGVPAGNPGMNPPPLF